MIGSPAIVIKDRGLLFDRVATFEIDTFAAQVPDISIIVDIYDLDNPVHPEGHLGWWKFEAATLASRVAAELLRDDAGSLDVVLGEAGAVDRWINPHGPRTTRLVVHAVLRSNATNALLADDRVPAMASARELADLRQSFDRTWSRPRFATSPFVPGRARTVHLVAPNIHQRDAVGNLCLDLYRLLRQNDIPVKLYADHVDLPLTDIVMQQMLLPAEVATDDQLLYFCSTSDPHLAEIAQLPIRKSAYFHGITDPAKLRVFDPELSVNAARGIASLSLLAGFDILGANSLHSAELIATATGRPRTEVVVVPPKLVAEGEQARIRHSGESGVDLLSVGQLNPHKKIEDVLRLFAAYRQHQPASKCHVVGRERSRAYRDYLRWVEASELRLPEGAVVWHGSVEDARLEQLYRSAAVLVSMSEDEGFALPLFEAMGQGTPVLAYGIPAVRETLGGAGLSFSAKQYGHLAEVLQKLLADGPRRQAIVDRQSRRYDELARLMTGERFFDLLMPAWPR